MKYFGNNSLILKLLCSNALILSIGLGHAFSQPGETRAKNNPYSPSPSSKAKSAETKPAGSREVAFVMNRNESAVRDDSAPLIDVRPSIAQATYKIAKAAETRNTLPTEIYKIGAGDVLYINIKDAPTGSGYFTVRPNGSIDFPLAGEDVVVAGHTIDSAEEIIAGGITIFKDPIVKVTMRQYGSHRIEVSGLVENGGEKYLQREAMPLFAIRAEAVVSSKATRVAITKAAGQKAEMFDLSDRKTEEINIFPGYSVEFIGEGASSTSSASYIIAGSVNSAGQKDLTEGLTLYQAVVIAGVKADAKRAVIRRKNDKGLFTNLEINLRSVRDGKMMDPRLVSGDLIEVVN